MSLIGLAGAAGCVSTPKFRPIDEGHWFARMGAHMQNLADIVENAADDKAAAKALHAYCGSRAELVAMLDFKSIDFNETPTPEEAERLQTATRRFSGALDKRQQWMQNPDFLAGFERCMAIKKDDSETMGDRPEGTDDIYMSAWDTIADDNCEAFAKVVWPCFEDVPEEDREAAHSAFENLGLRIAELGAEDASQQTAMCATLVKATEANPVCPAVFRAIDGAGVNE
jgi:hypothetical protein